MCALRLRLCAAARGGERRPGADRRTGNGAGYADKACHKKIKRFHEQKLIAPRRHTVRGVAWLVSAGYRPVVAKTDTVGDRIHARRSELGLSQRDLSAPGLSAAYISRIERGTRTPSVKALRQLALQLKTTLHWLETGEEDPVVALVEFLLAHRDDVPPRAVELARHLRDSHR